MTKSPPLLEVRGLRVHFPATVDVFGRARGTVKAVDGVSFTLGAGETVGLAGESGCGKSTLGRAIVRLIDSTEGTIRLEGEDITRMTGAALRARRKKMQMIFQDPHGSLDPRLTVGESIGEALDIHRLAGSPAERRLRVVELLARVRLDASWAGRYPHELSGGQRQRVGIARALAVEPKLIVCDEAVSALDVSVQAEIVNLLKDLQQERGLAYLFIAHDLALVEHISRRLMVMYLGKVVEMGGSGEVVRAPAHPYTRALISAVPDLEARSPGHRGALAGDVPSPIQPPLGCPFHPRCPFAEFPRCATEPPPLRELTPGRFAACHLAEQLPPGGD